MFKNWGSDTDNNKTEDNGISGELTSDRKATKTESITDSNSPDESVNTILKGSKLTGDINVTCDLELSGDVDGNITSLEDSNIVLKGCCAGNIETKGGDVEIDGTVQKGNITAGGNVTIRGKFRGGEVRANGCIYVNGEFEGRLQGSEIAIGENARGKGELLYKDAISIAKGARVDVNAGPANEEAKGAGKLLKNKTAGTGERDKETPPNSGPALQKNAG